MLNLKIKKQFGQNFIINKKIIINMIKIIKINKYDNILEIGSGIGLITQKILDITNKLYSIEIDNDLIIMLLNKFYFYPNYYLYKKNIINLNLNKLNINNIRVLGNLPYNISIKILFKLIIYKKNIKDMYLMFQKEVAMRILAKKGQKYWGGLTVIIQYYFKVFKIFDLSSENFIPKPKVDSTLIKLIPYKKLPFIVTNKKRFFFIVKKSFSKKRKTLKNNLKGLIDSFNLKLLKINPERRAETLSINEFVKLTNKIIELN
ncbi:16S rRNA (adenine(1518)-N(6)/adenine(1519)-N(6))-dimethyltransferase RsmA [Candidatus Portiera aleyrodidarum]|uniref:Ribosomal RNA small subunit methyltransferase A n=1 Tax=Candidatus Portiera aleyrodidarum TaxID=91844 RepID=A0A8D9JR63_9GAMM|nr:16S rRNA (adenine(1518)-N(6)/adenine(1519)-N(6))-dimethyltransferase RsmA [Candidatus Portiera aleyrodidarum]CEI58727.1 Ribosomal RNA small subunit methyltransferase A [Candidatus Portiera aleyrodidarum]